MVGGTLRRGGGGGSCAGYFAGNRSLVTGKSPTRLRQAPPPSGLHREHHIPENLKLHKFELHCTIFTIHQYCYNIDINFAAL